MPRKQKPTAPTPSKYPLGLRLSLGIGGVILLIGLLAVIAYLGLEYRYTNLVYPGVTLAGQAVGGKDFTDTAALIQRYEDQLSTDGLTFTYDETNLSLPEAVNVDVDKSAQAAFAVGRSSAVPDNLRDKLTGLTSGFDLPLIYTLDETTTVEQLQAQFDPLITPYQNAQLSYSDDALTVIPDSAGTSFHWDAVLAEVRLALANLQPVDLQLEITYQPAPVTAADVTAVLPQAEAMLALAPISLTYEERTFTVEEAELASWLTLDTTAGSPQLTLNEETVRASLAIIAGAIDVPVQEGRFSLDLVAGAVQLTQFQAGQDGLGVTIDTMLANIAKAILEDGVSTIPLVVAVTQPRATPDSLDDLGIKELLGTGTTNFAGSPYNRILNIRKGAEMLSGLLIAPGETFSLLDVLKPIDTAHGWYSELVIKGDQLEKEAGGGLCQVGSTSFRAAMLAGLPIVERRNHSWAISYYAYKGKAGVDATIYDPSPDFRFLNDTGHYILWRSRIEGSDIYFELWGTSDGRKGYFTDPVNYNYASPGPTIETVDPNAAPGSRTCDGHAFTGVTASFDYIIERADGTVDTENFTSVYKARPQYCIVGPTAATETTVEEIEEPVTDTPTNTNTNTNATKKKKNN